MKTIEVVAAIIVKNDKILCTQRADKGEVALKWEFPGGKIEKGESNEQALVREIKEELDCDINVNDLFLTVEHQYEGFYLIMHSYRCEMISEGFHLNEHVNSAWLEKEKLNTVDWAPADIPIANKLSKE